MAVIKENVPGIEFPLQIDRQYGAPIDKYSVFYSQSNAEEYAKNSPLAYVGQIVVIVSSDNNSAKVFVIADTSGKLTELTNTDVSEAIKEEVLKECKAYTDDKSKEIDSKAQEYAENAKTEAIGVASAYSDQNLETGKAYTDSEVTKAKTSVNEYSDSKNDELEETLNNTIESTKNELETTIEQKFGELANALVFKGVVNSNDDLPSDPKVGDTWKIGKAGTYAGQVCEIGDLIIWSDQNEWVIVQANEDGIVTNPGESADQNIVVFEGVTGKRIQDSGISKNSIQETIDKAHIHANKDKLDTFDKTQTEILKYTDDKVSEVQGNVDKETSAREQAISNLNNALSEESTTRESKDNELETNITNLRTYVDEQNESQDSKITDLQTGLSKTKQDLLDSNNQFKEEIEQLKKVDGNLQDGIGEVQENLNKAVEDINGSISSLLPENKALVYKGEITSDSSISSDYKVGWVHRIAASGVYLGVSCDKGDFIVATTKTNSTPLTEKDITSIGYPNNQPGNNYLKLHLKGLSWREDKQAFIVDSKDKIAMTLYQAGSVNSTDSSVGDFHYGSSGRYMIQLIQEPYLNADAGTMTSTWDSNSGGANGITILTYGGSSVPRMYDLNITADFTNRDIVNCTITCPLSFKTFIRNSWTEMATGTLAFSFNLIRNVNNDWSRISGGTSWGDISHA